MPALKEFLTRDRLKKRASAGPVIDNLTHHSGTPRRKEQTIHSFSVVRRGSLSSAQHRVSPITLPPKTKEQRTVKRRQMPRVPASRKPKHRAIQDLGRLSVSCRPLWGGRVKRADGGNSQWIKTTAWTGLVCPCLMQCRAEMRPCGSCRLACAPYLDHLISTSWTREKPQARSSY